MTSVGVRDSTLVVAGARAVYMAAAPSFKVSCILLLKATFAKMVQWHRAAKLAAHAATLQDLLALMKQCSVLASMCLLRAVMIDAATNITRNGRSVWSLASQCHPKASPNAIVTVYAYGSHRH